MDLHVVATLLVGALALATAWLPAILRDLPLSLPIVAIAAGAGVFFAAGQPDLSAYRPAWQALTEYVLVIAVMGAGLKIDRPFLWRAWSSTWRLLALAMPLSIALVAVAASAILGWPAALALLIGAILAPTDPVLASDVQVGPPGEGEAGEVRFALTSEAGLNDGVAMPFVLLALGLMAAGQGGGPGFSVAHWAATELLWGVVAGAGFGAACGWGLVVGDRSLPERFQLHEAADGLAVLGVSLLVYALAELAGVNGFVAVFAAAVATRNAAASSVEFARELHVFADQLERIMMVVLMSVFGALLAGGLLAGLTWRDLGFVLVVLLVVRPVAVLVGHIGSPISWPTRLALGYFGIRGLGSLFYLFFALHHAKLAEAETLRSLVALAVLISVALYGLTSTGVMRMLDRRRDHEGALYDGPVLGEEDRAVRGPA